MIWLMAFLIGVLVVASSGEDWVFWAGVLAFLTVIFGLFGFLGGIVALLILAIPVAIFIRSLE